ncbi:MAG TPA: nitrile hydratase subunit beta [Chthoniobacterales bacterium]
MKLQHHLGGLEGLGPVNFETRVFVEPWEQRIFGIHVAMMGMSLHLSDSVAKYPIEKLPTAFKSTWTWADLRKGAEAMNPFDYFKYRYYEKWLGGISGFFVSQGYISQKELDARTAAILEGEKPSASPLMNDEIDRQIIEYLRVGDQGGREGERKPKYAAGDSLTVKDVASVDHTRLPGHLRGKAGVVEKLYPGLYVYFCSTGPDGLGDPMPVYQMRFDPKEIWGDLAEPNSTVYADLYETYLEGEPTRC